MNGAGFDIDKFLEIVGEAVGEIVERTGGNEDIIVNLVNEINELAGGEEDIISVELRENNTVGLLPDIEMHSREEIEQDFLEGTNYLHNIVDMLLDDRAHLQAQIEELKKYIEGEE